MGEAGHNSNTPKSPPYAHESGSFRNALKLALSFLGPRDKRVLGFMVAGQIFIALLDMLGALLLGIVAALIVSLLEPTVNVVGVGIPSFLTDMSPGLVLVIVAACATSLLATKSLASWFMSRQIMRFMAKKSVTIARQLYDRYMNAPYALSRRISGQRAISAIYGGSHSLASIVTQAASLVSEIFLLVGLSALLAIASPVLFLFTITFYGAMTVVLSTIVGRKARKSQLTATDASVESGQRLADIIGLTRELRVYGLSPKYGDHMGELMEVSALASAEQNSWAQAPRYVLESALLVGIAGAAGLVIWTQPPEKAAFSLGLYLVASSRMIPSIQRVNGSWAAVKAAIGSLIVLRELLALPTLLPEKPATGPSRKSEQQLQETRRALSARDLTFTYPGSTSPALDSLSLDVEIPSRIAIVGASGAGKSTFGDLLLGLLTPDQGSVATEADGELHSLGSVAFVSQDVFLSPASVRANVSLCLPGDAVDDELVWEALRLAQVDGVVRALPEQLDTYLGERGLRLSGGQRQRIGLARALYRHPSLLLLDEATSSLDAETERSVTSALRTIPGEITVVTIAHRLATIRESDAVIFLRLGRLVDVGSFDELISRHPDLANAAQLQGLVDEVGRRSGPEPLSATSQ